MRNAVGMADTITSSLTSDTFTFEYDATGALLAALLPNNLSNRLSYNAAHEPVAVTAGHSTINYSRDTTGLIISKVTNGAGKHYSYDAGQRLISADTTTYAYDIAGNNRNNNAIFSPETNRLLEDNNTAYSYSPAGNLVQKQSKIDGSRSAYTWNRRNQLLKVTRYDGQNQLIREQSFTYDPLGRRVSKTSNNQTFYYLYDNQDIVGILNHNREILSTVVHAEYIDTPLSITTGDQTYYYHQDHQGSILSLTDALQNEIETYSYDPYGVTSLNQTVTTNNPYAFTGRELDDTDLYYYRARYYDPTIQRFLSEDPIGFWSGDFNFYRYIGNDPVNWVDPWGLEKICTLPHANGIKWFDTGKTQIKYEIIKSLQIARFVIGIRFSQKRMDGASEMADKFTSNVYVAWEYSEMEAFSVFTKVCYLVECGEVIGGPFFEDSFESTGQKKWDKRWRKGFVLGD